MMKETRLKSKYIFLILILTLIGCAASEEFVRLGTNFQKYRRIAVFPLADYPTHPGSGIQVADIISMRLLGFNFSVIDRSQTLCILAEQDLGMIGIVDELTAPKVGKLLGVQAIFTGSINEWQSTSTNVQLVQGATPAYMDISAAGITLKLIDCETGEIVWAGSARGSAYGLNFEAMAARKAVDDILEKLNNHLK